MLRTCLKCQFVNQDADGKETDSCPKCGAIYVKVERSILEAAARAPERERSSRNWSIFVWIFVCIGGLVGVYLAVVILLALFSLLGWLVHLPGHQGSGA